ncbi:C-C motif chemokine 24 [Lepus europaeus]|uniref:C-C motif chemokine 24 n=1 Tax=Lepus europaeus TaxID=9983 RepID=UPI002B492AFD|nr:C-C motif chemokine 24 [Lepus europaeus]
MAGPATIAASLLLLALGAHHLIPAGTVGIPSSCCMNFIPKKIPESHVVSYQLSSGSVCPRAGVIFTTKKGYKVCSDPKQQWVQSYVRNLEAKGRKSSMGARAPGGRRPGQTRA